MCKPVSNEPFHSTKGGQFLSKQEIVDLYQSREHMLVPFECMKALSVSCSFANREVMPKEKACLLYGANDKVSLLETTTGTAVVIDGCRCFPVWKEAVRKGELPQHVVVNVIKASKNLTDAEMLQLATYCNIRSRETKMSCMSEKIHIVQAFCVALSRTQRAVEAAGEDWNTYCFQTRGRKGHRTSTIGKALYNTSLFDEYVSHPLRPKDIEYPENMIRVIVRTCLRLSVEDELMEAIKYMCERSPGTSQAYFRSQFFVDYASGWFQSSPLLKQILLIFVLPSFPYITNRTLTPTDSVSSKVRGKLRKRIPKICEEICRFICSFPFSLPFQSESSSAAEENIFHWSSTNRKTEELSIPVIEDIAFDIISAIFETECSLLNNTHTRSLSEGTMGQNVIRNAKERISKRPLRLFADNLWLLFK